MKIKSLIRLVFVAMSVTIIVLALFFVDNVKAQTQNTDPIAIHVGETFNSSNERHYDSKGPYDVDSLRFDVNPRPGFERSYVDRDTKYTKIPSQTYYVVDLLLDQSDFSSIQCIDVSHHMSFLPLVGYDYWSNCNTRNYKDIYIANNDNYLIVNKKGDLKTNNSSPLLRIYLSALQQYSSATVPRGYLPWRDGTVTIKYKNGSKKEIEIFKLSDIKVSNVGLSNIDATVASEEVDSVPYNTVNFMLPKTVIKYRSRDITDKIKFTTTYSIEPMFKVVDKLNNVVDAPWLIKAPIMDRCKLGPFENTDNNRCSLMYLKILSIEGKVVFNLTSKISILGNNLLPLLYTVSAPGYPLNYTNQPPSAPTDLQAKVKNNSVELSWLSSIDDSRNKISYRIYRDNKLLYDMYNGYAGPYDIYPSIYTKPVLTRVAFSDRGSTYGKRSYYVVAYDTGKQSSEPSNTITFDPQTGESGQSATTAIVPPLPPADTQPPSIPSNVTAIAKSTSEILLQWSASTDNVGVDLYRIYRDGVYRMTVYSSAFLDTGLRSGQGYTYTITACDKVGNCSNSSASVTEWTLSNTTPTTDTQPPSIPSNLTATPGTPDLCKNYNNRVTVKLNWSPSTDNVRVAGYRVYRNSLYLSGLGSEKLTVPATGGQYFCDGIEPENGYLEPGTQYTYYVQAVDVNGNISGPSALVIVRTSSANTTSTTDTQSPSIPSNLTATPLSTSQIRLNWSASTDNVGVAGYQIYRNSSLITNTTATTYIDSGLSANNTYSYYIKSYDAKGNYSNPSASVTEWTQSTSNTNTGNTSTTDTQPPSLPSNVTATAVSSSQIRLNWSASTDNVAVTGYKVYRNGSLLNTTSATTYTDSGLQPSTDYYYYVQAYDAKGNVSNSSASVTEWTQDASTSGPSAPLSPPCTGSTCIKLNYKAENYFASAINGFLQSILVK